MADRERIERFRRSHDLPFKDAVAAHFTLVFGDATMGRTDYIAHVREAAGATGPIDFVCRYAMQGVDHENGRVYVFLVPGEGHSHISRLQDLLYSGELAQALRLDIPFIPHIAIETLPTTRDAKIPCDRWNVESFAMTGRIDTLSISTLGADRVSDVAHVPLGAGDRMPD